MSIADISELTPAQAYAVLYILTGDGDPDVTAAVADAIARAKARG